MRNTKKQIKIAIKFQLHLHKSLREQWLYNPCPLPQSDAKKTNFSPSIYTCGNQSLKILLFLSNHIDHRMVEEQINQIFVRLLWSHTIINQRKSSILLVAIHSLPLLLKNLCHSSRYLAMKE